MAPRCSAADATTAVVVAVVLVVAVVVVAAAGEDEQRGGTSNFRLDFSPFATVDLPRRLIHSRNRGGSRRSADVQAEEEKRDPCYSVVVKLGKLKEREKCRKKFTTGTGFEPKIPLVGKASWGRIQIREVNFFNMAILEHKI